MFAAFLFSSAELGSKLGFKATALPSRFSIEKPQRPEVRQWEAEGTGFVTAKPCFSGSAARFPHLGPWVFF